MVANLNCLRCLSVCLDTSNNALSLVAGFFAGPFLALREDFSAEIYNTQKSKLKKRKEKKKKKTQIILSALCP